MEPTAIAIVYFGAIALFGAVIAVAGAIPMTAVLINAGLGLGSYAVGRKVISHNPIKRYKRLCVKS